MSSAERVTVSTFAGQLFVDVWLVEDDAFRRDAERFAASLSNGKYDVLDPASLRMKSWSVVAVNDRGDRLDVMATRAGGSGTETHMAWALLTVDDRPIDVTVRHIGEVVWKTDGLTPVVDENQEPLGADTLQKLRPLQQPE